jgi:hypothetical protein
MEPGDPFATKKLDKHRARQRRALRLIESQIVKGIAAGSDVEFGDVPDSGLLEVKLRELADAEFESLGPDLIEQMERIEVADVLAPVLSEHDGRTFHRHAGKFRPDFEAIRKECWEERNVESPEPPPGLIRAVVFLIWADTLAGADYVDPRVREIRERRARRS